MTAKLRRQIVGTTDKRVTQMNEILNAIRLIKMYAWEMPFAKRIEKLREEETRGLRKAAFLQSLSLSMTPAITVVAAIATFFALTYENSHLKEFAFTVESKEIIFFVLWGFCAP